VAVSYQERPSQIAGAVVWTRTADGSHGWVLPDGCMDLIWDGSRLVVAGPDTGPHQPSAPAGTAFAAIRFAPGTGPQVVGVPADQLRNQRVPLEELWSGDAVARIVDRLHAAADDADVVLEAVSAARLDQAPPDPLGAEVVRRVGGGHPIGAVADAVGLSERQLHRRSLVAIGYGPKVLARILRLQRALGLARAGSPFAAAAAEAGYADQAHLAREVRSLAGAPLTELLA
jgi:AraC-like DNA-binding protein